MPDKKAEGENREDEESPEVRRKNMFLYLASGIRSRRMKKNYFGSKQRDDMIIGKEKQDS